MATIRRRSRIETELPQDIRASLDRLLLEGATYEEASEWLHERGHDISRSSIGRYGKEFFKAYQDVKRFEDQARAMTSDAGEDLALEEATTKMMLQKVMAAIISGDVDLMEKPRLLSDVAKLQSAAISREKLKADFADRAKKAAASVEKIAKKGGLTDEAVNQIKAKILGITR